MFRHYKKKVAIFTPKLFFVKKVKGEKYSSFMKKEKNIFKNKKVMLLQVIILTENSMKF